MTPAAGSRILVVGEDRCVREQLRIHLRNAGYEVDMAEDAVAALRAMLQQPPQLMIVDTDMEHMNGLDLVSTVKGDRGVAHIPVVFLTERDDMEDAASKAGVLRCLRMPLFADRLLSAIAGVLPEGRFSFG